MADETTTGPVDESVVYPPDPFEHDGRRFYPAFVAMYGRRSWIEPLRNVVDEHDGMLSACHQILWAVEPADG